MNAQIEVRETLKRLISAAKAYKQKHGSLRGCDLSREILACLQDGYHFHDIQPHLHAIEKPA